VSRTLRREYNPTIARIRLGSAASSIVEEICVAFGFCNEGVATMQNVLGRILLALAATSLVPGHTAAQTAPSAAQRKQDIADMVAGTYSGSVIADTRGGSQSDVSITVTKVAKNVVSISSDYARIPTVQIALTRASDAIIAARPGNGFLIELAKDPRRLDLSIDGATWMGHKD
jgi:hypothetical protein